MKKRIRIQGILIFFAMSATIFLSRYLFPDRQNYLSDKFFEISGIGLILVGFLFRIVARGYKEEQSECGGRLIKGGPYQLMRNPMYFGTLLIGTGVIASIFEWWVFLFFIIIYSMIYFPQVKNEENVLSARFGTEYSDYCSGTPRYLPNISLMVKRLPACMFFKWAWVKKESVSLASVLALVIFIHAWQYSRLFGLQVYGKEILKSVITVIAGISGIIVIFHGKENNTTIK